MVLTMENPLPIATMNDVDDNYVVRWIRRKKTEKVRNRKDEDSLVLSEEDRRYHTFDLMTCCCYKHCRSNQSTFFWFNLTEILWFVSPSSLPYCLFWKFLWFGSLLFQIKHGIRVLHNHVNHLIN
jgi:hypothetical protein